LEVVAEGNTGEIQTKFNIDKVGAGTKAGRGDVTVGGVLAALGAYLLTVWLAEKNCP